ncbi:MAG: ABC transporter substrate-binding protein, partial [Chloroflexota bacterium]|nr:ABC transporter substrate-binding protein [Chloroflexota bacterium]
MRSNHRVGQLITLSLGVLLALALGACAPASPGPTPTKTAPGALATAPPAREAQTDKGQAPATAPPSTAKKPDKMRIQVPAKSISTYMYYFGKDKGIYMEEGIDAEIAIMAANLAVPALLSGDVDYSGMGFGPFSAGLKGAEVKQILSTVSAPVWHVVAKQGVTSVKDLKGGKVAVLSLGGPDHFVTSQALAKLGLDPAKDVTFVQIPAGSILQALRTGSVEAAALSQPDTALAKREGLKDLVFTGEIMPLAVNGLA